MIYTQYGSPVKIKRYHSDQMTVDVERIEDGKVWMRLSLAFLRFDTNEEMKEVSARLVAANTPIS
jgi:hypothetical protein